MDDVVNIQKYKNDIPLYQYAEENKTQIVACYLNNHNKKLTARLFGMTRWGVETALYLMGHKDMIAPSYLKMLNVANKKTNGSSIFNNANKIAQYFLASGKNKLKTAQHFKISDSSVSWALIYAGFSQYSNATTIARYLEIHPDGLPPSVPDPMSLKTHKGEITKNQIVELQKKDMGIEKIAKVLNTTVYQVRKALKDKQTTESIPTIENTNLPYPTFDQITDYLFQMMNKATQYSILKAALKERTQQVEQLKVANQQLAESNDELKKQLNDINQKKLQWEAVARGALVTPGD